MLRRIQWRRMRISPSTCTLSRALACDFRWSITAVDLSCRVVSCRVLAGPGSGSDAAESRPVPDATSHAASSRDNRRRLATGGKRPWEHRQSAIYPAPDIILRTPYQFRTHQSTRNTSLGVTYGPRVGVWGVSVPFGSRTSLQPTPGEVELSTSNSGLIILTSGASLAEAPVWSARVGDCYDIAASIR